MELPAGESGQVALPSPADHRVGLVTTEGVAVVEAESRHRRWRGRRLAVGQRPVDDFHLYERAGMVGCEVEAQLLAGYGANLAGGLAAAPPPADLDEEGAKV